MLGEELKRRREELGLSLAQISEVTRIGTRFLRAIESNDFSTLPEGIYTRSFIRAYAKHVHMDEDRALELYHEQTGEISGLSDGGVVDADDSSFVYKEPSSSFWPAAVVAAALALAFITGSWALWHYVNKPPEDGAIAAVPAQQPAEEVAPAPAQETQPVSLGDGLMVTLQASQDCWIKYTADDGEPTQMLLKDGDEERIQATQSIDLSIGNTTAVSMLINGREAHFPADTGVVLRKLTITPETAKDLITPAPQSVQ